MFAFREHKGLAYAINDFYGKSEKALAEEIQTKYWF
jgi:hypothetical protein